MPYQATIDYLYSRLPMFSRIGAAAIKNNLDGVYNAVSPNPVTNEELTFSIAKVLKKPLFMPNVPKFAMKLILGEMHELLFENRNLSANKIKDKGFEFKYKSIDEALINILS